MTHDSTEGFEFDLGFDNDSYDPLEDLGPDDDELDDEGGEQLSTASPNSEALPAPAPEKVDDRPASERIAELFREMKPRRRVLLGILASLETFASLGRDNEFPQMKALFLPCSSVFSPDRSVRD